MTDARALIAQARENYVQWDDVQHLADLAEALLEEHEAKFAVEEFLLSGVAFAVGDDYMVLQLRVDQSRARVRALLEPKP